MAVYNNSNKFSALSSVEFTPVSDGNFTFFYLDNARGDKEALRQWLVSKEVGQEIVAETVVDNHPVFVTKGDKTKDEMMKSLEERGDKFELKIVKKPFNWWALRGGLSVVGQTLHLASAILGVEQLGKDHPRLNPANAHYNPKLKEGMYVRKVFQKDIGVFALLNQTANLANIIYGGQEEKGDNRLHAVKEEINQDLGEHLAVGDTPIGILENRSSLRKGPEQPLTTTQKIDEFARKYSVRFFEIGLRVLGTTALIVPWRKENLSKGWEALRKGHVLDAWKGAKNKDKYYFWAGMCYMTGKILSFCAKVPDPYEDKPHTWVDTLREKYLFKAGTVVEAAAGTLMATNAFTQKKMGFSDPNRPDIKPYRDYMSGVGGSLFVMGFGARLFAPFGSKHVDMEEIYAHAADTLAMTPKEKLPQLMAETAAGLKEHFKDKPMEFGEIYTKMMEDLYRYHDKAIINPETEAEKQPAAGSAQPQAAKFTVSNPSRTIAERAGTPADNFAEAASKTPDAAEASFGMGA